MKIAISGATGIVGQMIVPLLLGKGVQVAVIGRDPERLTAAYPHLPRLTYDTFLDDGQGFDVVLNLAHPDKGAAAELSVFQSVNVDLALALAQTAATGGAHFINVSCFQAMDDNNLSADAVTQRAASQRLSATYGDAVTTVFLPAVHGNQGRLAAWPALSGLRLGAAITPTVHAQELVDFILRTPKGAGQVMLSDDQDRNLIFTAFKRTVDLAFAFTVILLLWWLLLVVWVVVKRGSAGPGIFAQQRIGRFGRTFTCYKFRTMHQGTLNRQTHELSPSAITKVGAFLRRTKIDELPQVWNILCNDMSLIGPRPCLPSQTELIAARKALGVLDIKPGISGLAQVNDIDMSRPQVLAKWDARYKAMRSLGFDVRIILATLRGKGQGDRTKA